jgi:hypothetical protein
MKRMTREEAGSETIEVTPETLAYHYEEADARGRGYLAQAFGRVWPGLIPTGNPYPEDSEDWEAFRAGEALAQLDETLDAVNDATERPSKQ